jgi:hypothetical protein
MNLKLYWDYFKYVLEHKKNVFKTCWQRKLYLHAFTHDLSKFSPKEFFAYADWFYGDLGIKNKCPAKWADKNHCKVKENFDKAWEHHYKNNPHHWEYWLDQNGKPQFIPPLYREQMIADWEGMALKFGDTAQSYYLKNYKKINLEYGTRVLLELALDLNDSPAHNCGRTLEDFAKSNDEQTYNKYFGYIKDQYGIDTYNLLK